ncbi:MAG: putative toxin-antitoxin system toxin component, PIN family [Chloroflexi bacterium]|nr:putative toxin-antitoxin system toxin component, PIN family [Chloroflexota bacterium]
MARERVVLDTNVFLSGLFSSTSTPARAVERAVREDRILVSTETLRELAEQLLSPKFDRYVPSERRLALLDRLAPNLEVVEIVQQVRASRDPKDDAFLEVAVNGSADLIVTGDRDLIALHPFRGIDIVRPADYLVRKP